MGAPPLTDLRAPGCARARSRPDSSTACCRTRALPRRPTPPAGGRSRAGRRRGPALQAGSLLAPLPTSLSWRWGGCSHLPEASGVTQCRTARPLTPAGEPGSGAVRLEHSGASPPASAPVSPRSNALASTFSSTASRRADPGPNTTHASGDRMCLVVIHTTQLPGWERRRARRTAARGAALAPLRLLLGCACTNGVKGAAAAGGRAGGRRRRRRPARASPRSGRRWRPCSRCPSRRPCAPARRACCPARRATRWTACAGARPALHHFLGIHAGRRAPARGPLRGTFSGVLLNHLLSSNCASKQPACRQFCKSNGP